MLLKAGKLYTKCSGNCISSTELCPSKSTKIAWAHFTCQDLQLVGTSFFIKQASLLFCFKLQPCVQHSMSSCIVIKI